MRLNSAYESSDTWRMIVSQVTSINCQDKVGQLPSQPIKKYLKDHPLKLEC